MKLYNPATKIMVDFYPVRPAHGEPVSKQWFLKVVDFGGRTSKSFKNRVEMNREVNTVGSKAAEHPISARVVEMKSTLERMREQAANVE